MSIQRKKVALALSLFLVISGCGANKNETDHNGNRNKEGVNTEQVIGAIDILRDPNFKEGFNLKKLDTLADGDLVVAHLDYGRGDAQPVWELAQWFSKFSLKNAMPQAEPGGGISYTNEGKRIVVSSMGSEQYEVILEVFGSAEYGDRPREIDESWPHLLLEQQILPKPKLSELQNLHLDLSSRLLSIKSFMEKPDPIHTAQFQLYFIIGDPVAGDMYWFGVPIYDWRYKMLEPYMNADGGKEDASGKFIYLPASTEFTSQSAHSGEWLIYDKDILTYMEDAFKEAVKAGYMQKSNWDDLVIDSIHLGWEVTGTFDVSYQIKNFRLTATKKESN